MTRYMLDTNIISDLVRNPQGKAAKRIAKVGDGSVCTSIIVAAELRYGCAKSGSTRLLKAVEDVLSRNRRAAIRRACRCRLRRQSARSWRPAGRPIGSNDLLIAAHARAGDATVVTANAAEFRRVRGLKVENWLI